MCRRTGLVSAVLCVLLVMLCAASSAHAQCSSSNCQIILSGTALPATGSQCTPWGLWVWSEPNTNNAYGNDGDGSIYFYGIHKAEAHVEASDVILTGSSVSETLSGAYPDGTAVSCTLAAHQTSPGKGVLDSMSCTVGTKSCTAPVGGIPITVDISNVKN
jgi:hypothetical protein